MAIRPHPIIIAQHDLIDTLTQVAQDMPALIATLEGTAAIGYPTGSDDPPVNTGGHTTSIVEAQALIARGAISELRHVIDGLGEARSRLERIRRIQQRWLTRVPQRDARALTSDHIDPAPNCDSCARLKDHTGRPTMWNPVHTRSDVAGNLNAPKALCRWCYDFARHWGRLPNHGELETHRQGKPVPRHTRTT